MDLNTPEPNVDSLTRFQSLEAGQYWRALQEIVEEGIDAGTVLLIQSIRWVENAAHTIILRPHPLKIGKTCYLRIPNENGEISERWFKYDEHRFLVDDFLARFEFEPDFKRIREAEVADVQARVTELQQELVKTQATPALMADVVKDGLRELDEKQRKSGKEPAPALGVGDPEGPGLVTLATGTVTGALNAGVTPATIERMKALANREHQIAEVKAGWITGMTTRISETVAAMTPFYAEQAAAALAQTEEVRNYVTKLMRGIASLDLYVGKDVEVVAIREGAPAPSHVPLTFVQAKLMVDEELAVWTDIDQWFDFTKEEAFHEALREHDGLVNQLFPTERCVIVMATTRRHINYGDAWTDAAKNRINRDVFLLVRNGMNIHKVISPVESHLGAARLFPTKDDQERIFRGFDGTQITLQDVAYTDKLAEHEQFALHYKRFLLLVCGLDHRLKLFGTFYEGPESFDFLSLPFQEQHFHFLHDDDASHRLGGDTHIPVQKWIEGMNAYLRSGSRVLCSWRQVMDPDTAPSACFAYSSGGGFDRRYTPEESLGVAIAYKDGDSLCVDVEVSGQSARDWKDRTFKCKVNLSKQGEQERESDLPTLCLDAVTPEDLRWYIFNRQSRVNHLSYIRFFKRALKFVEAERIEEADTRARLLQALRDGKVGDEEERAGLVDRAVIAWRAAQRGGPLPKFEHGNASRAWKSLLNQLYMLAGEGERRVEAVRTFLEERGLTPLRLVLSGSAKLVAYAAPAEHERDDRVIPHVWVHRITLETTKTGYAERSRRWAVLPERAASETTIHQWAGAEAWSGLQSAFESFEAKRDAMAMVEGFLAALEPFAMPMTQERFDHLFSAWRQRRNEDLLGSRYVVNPNLAIPIGVVHHRHDGLSFLCVGSVRPHVLLHRIALNTDSSSRVMSEFLRPFRNKGAARANFLNGLEEPTDWVLLEVPVATFMKQKGLFRSERHQVMGNRSVMTTLGEGLTEWDRSARERKRSYWLAPGLLDDGGAVLDRALGVHLEGYKPCRVWSIELHGRGNAAAPSYSRWFDILSGEQPEDAGKGWSKDEQESLVSTIPWAKGLGQSYHMTVRPSLRSARCYIEDSVNPTKVDGWRAVPAAELPDAPPPPDGVERWYMVKADEQ